MAKAFFEVFAWIAILVGLVVAVLIVQTLVAYLRHDSIVPYSFIWRFVAGLFG